MNKKFAPENIRTDFPLLQQGTIYLDNAATSLTPLPVIDAITEYYRDYGVNVHRGIYKASEKASAAFEQTRTQVQKFINAVHVEEIIFTSGTTHSLNTIARSLGQLLEPGDEIIITEIEHHANIVPWQILAQEKKLKLKYLALDDKGLINPEQLDELITKKTKILSVAHISNASGYELPVMELINRAKKHQLYTIVDAAQSIPHFPVDVQQLDADFLVFSAHKMCGPTGVGVLYGKKELLNKLEPPFGGGSMIDQVNMETCSWAELPLKFEPGTPNIAGVIGFGRAIRYINEIGLDNIYKYVNELSQYAISELQKNQAITIHGPIDLPNNGIISFSVARVHPHDLAAILDQDNIAVRAGHHCAQPLMKHWQVPATTRASLYFYNTPDDVDKLTAGIQKAINKLK